MNTKKIKDTINIFIKNNDRSLLLIKNVLASFVAKGWSAIVVLLMVPLTLNCLGAYKNGVWLTVSSLLIWLDQMDIGLGNGLRNKLAIYVAHDDKEKARQIVSSTMAMLLVIIIPVMLILLLLVSYSDIYSFLNVDRQAIPELQAALTAAVVLVCMTFVLKFIGNVYMGMQMPAISNLLISLGQSLALLFTWWLYIEGNATFFWIVVVNTASPLIVYMFAYPLTFYLKYPELRPSLSYVRLHTAIEMGNIGIKFFWLQLASIMQFMTANILISKYFTPEMVTPYQIAYRYMSLVIVAFTVVCMPFWNATTDAYERGDIDWIRKANSKLNFLTLLLGGILIVMVSVSSWVYSVWIGKGCNVPFSITLTMAIYIYILVLSMRYSYFLNGIGALRLQLYMTVSAVVFILAACVVCSYTHEIVWFMITMCLCSMPGTIVNIIQFNKILKGNAKGIWRI